MLINKEYYFNDLYYLCDKFFRVMEDIIITIGIILAYIFISYRKYVKKQAAKQRAAQRKPNESTGKKSPFDTFEHPFGKQTNDTCSETYDATKATPYATQRKTVKTEGAPEFSHPHFSYDQDIPAEHFSYENNSTCERETIASSASEVEECKSSILDFDSDELWKGIIYSEIVKNPYNQ